MSNFRLPDGRLISGDVAFSLSAPGAAPAPPRVHVIQEMQPVLDDEGKPLLSSDGRSVIVIEVEREEIEHLPEPPAEDVLQFPAGYLKTASDEELAELGIAREDDAAPAEKVDIEAVRARFLRAIDEQAEEERAKYLTPGTGMALTYQEKLAQANAVQALGKSAANKLAAADYETQFPTLSASVGIEADTLWDCAQLVLRKYAEVSAISRRIERTRLASKKAAAGAETVEEISALNCALVWE